MIIITLEELKIIISAETKTATAQVQRLKSDISGLSRTSSININAKSSGFSQLFADLKANLGDIRGSSDAVGRYISHALAGALGSAITRTKDLKRAFQDVSAEIVDITEELEWLKSSEAFSELGAEAVEFGINTRTADLGKLTSESSELSAAMGGAAVSGGKLGGVLTTLKGIATKFWPVLVALAAALAALAPLLISIGAIKFGEALVRWTASAAQTEAAVLNLTSSLGEAGSALSEWVQKNAASMGLSLQDAYTYANQLQLLVSSFANSSEQTAAGTANLMNAATIVASKTGRTVQDVLERFRSGMLGNTESIEDIGIQVAQSVIEQSDAFKQLGVSYQNLTAQQKSYLYYQAIINQTADKYGNEVAPNAMTTTNRFTAALANLKLAFSQLVLPIANVVLPWLTTFITYLTALVRIVGKVVAALLGLFGIEVKTADVSTDMSKTMGKTAGAAGGVADGLGSAAKSAKEIRKSLAGFDEINNLGAEPTDAGGGAGGGGGVGDIGNIPDLSEMFPDIEGVMVTVEQAMKNILKGMLMWLDPFYDYVTGTFDNIRTYIETTFKNIGKLVRGFSSGAVKVFEGFYTLVTGIWGELETFINKVWEAIVDLFSGNIGPKEFFTRVFGAAKTAVEGIGNQLKSSLGTTWSGIKQIYSSVATFFSNQFGAAKTAIMTQWGLVKSFFETQWNNIKIVFGPVASWFGTKFGEAWTAIKTKFAPFVSFFEGLWKSVKGVFTTIGVSLSNSITGAINGIFYQIEIKINKFIGNINTAISLINKIPGVSVGRIPTITLPRLAKGGIVDSAQMFIAGEAGKEAVIPLERNLEWADKVASVISSKLGGGGNSDRPLTIVLKVNSAELGRATCDSINELIAREGAIPIHI